MRKNESADQPGSTRYLYLLTLLTLSICSASALAQSKVESPYYARVNTFGVFGAYSGDSSHISMGDAENRKLLDFGVSYSRKLFLNRNVNWQYSGELLPVALESDPRRLTLSTTKLRQRYIPLPSYDTAPSISCATVTTPYSIT